MAKKKDYSMYILIGGTTLLVAGGAVLFFRLYKIQDGKLIRKGSTDETNSSLNVLSDYEKLVNEVGGIIGNTGGSGISSGLSSFNKLPKGSYPVSKGQVSKYVYILQTYLNCKFNAGLTIDGEFGQKTQDALNKFLGILSITEAQVNFAITKGGACENEVLKKIKTL